MNLNVFQWPYSIRYYLTHPWKWFSQLWRNIKAAYHRIRYGWCSWDVWDWDSWFCSTTSSMLRYMTDHGSAYPGSEPFDTPEKWHDWLYEMAHRIERLQYDDWMEDNNEYSKDYEKTFEDDFYKEEHPNGPFLTTTYDSSLNKEEIRKKYYERCGEIHKTRQQVLEDFGKSFFKFFDCLWD